jgi:hypothetical protein
MSKWHTLAALMQESIFMRTTLDLPDDILRKAKIAAVERGSSLRQLVIDALRREMESFQGARRRRISKAPVTLVPDAPLRTLSADDVKRLDTEAAVAAEVTRALALRR